MIIPVYEVATLAELADWLGRCPTSLLTKLVRESLREENEVIRKSGATWLIDVKFALKHYEPVKDRPYYG